MTPILPVSHLRSLIPGGEDVRKFLLIGKKTFESISSALAHQGISLDSFESALEFGSICGIVSRHWPTKTCQLQCVEPDQLNVNWCIQYLRAVSTKLLENTTPLGNHELIFAPYLFTTFNEIDQDAWLNKLILALRPKGFLVIFLRSQQEALRNLQNEERKKYEAGEPVIINPKFSGSHRCKACHPETYIRRHYGKFLPVIDFVPAKIYKDSETSVLIKPFVVLRKIG